MAHDSSKVALISMREEQASAYLYAAMAAREEGEASRMFERLGRASRGQAELWVKRLHDAGIATPPFHPSFRERLIARMIDWLGPARLLPVLSAMKVRGLSVYRDGGPHKGPDALIASIAASPEERWHRQSRGGGALRAAVFGANDGIVSNAGLILGVAGADAEPQVVVLAGVAGLLAGGFSMAGGEYVSVRTQREMLEHQIALEREELRFMPEEEIEELTIIYQTRGLAPDDARSLAARMVADPEQGLRTLAREELGLDPDTLASPAAAAGASFASFAVGALVPLVPYLISFSQPALPWTLGATMLALLSVGAAMSLFTGRPAWYAALRMAAIGALAGGLTYGIGRLFGVALG